MVNILEEDVFNEGKNQITISNDVLKAVIVPEVGGRIAQIQFGETQFLHTAYPEGVSFGPYTEYGGIEECIGGAPGTLWNTSWKWEKKDNGILLQAMSRSVLVRKFITLDENEPMIRIKYDLINLGNTFSRSTFGIHPEINIGNAFKDNKYHISSKQEITTGGYEGAGVKKSIAIPDGWCAVTHDGKVFGQMFPMDTIDSVEVYYPKANSHLVLQPMIFGVGIAPDMRASFMYMIYAGNGEANLIKETRDWLDAEFVAEYASFDKTNIPQEILAMATTAPQPDVMVNVNPAVNIDLRMKEALEKMHNIEIPELPEIPNINFMAEKQQRKVEAQIEKVRKEIEKNVEKQMERANREMERVNREMERAEREREKAARIAERENRRRERIHVVEAFDSEGEPFGINTDKLVIRHMNGDISISVWDNPHIDFSINGNARDENESVMFETNGSLSLNIPQRISEIDLSFINGTVNINDYSSKLHVSGVNGVINVNMNGLPENESVSMSLVSGEIKLKVPEDSSCTIQATCTVGEVNCDLPIQEEIRTQTELKGTLNDGSANILLSIVRGKISIEKM